MKLRDRRLWIAMAVTAIVAPGSVFLATRLTGRTGAAESPLPAGALTVPRAPSRAAAGDVAHGGRLYAANCAPCHGKLGDGHGPAADVLWPPMRNHLDAAYMLSRTDEQLFDAVAKGGPAVFRSRLMPPWKDVFDRFETWNTIAYMRSLTPELPSGVARARYRQSLLSPDGLASLRALSLPSPVSVAEFLDDEDEIVGYGLYPRVTVMSAAVTFELRYGPAGDLRSVRTHEQLRIPNAPADAVDRRIESLPQGHDAAGLPADLSTQLAAVLDAARLAMPTILDQQRRDEGEARALYERFRREPETLAPGARLYMQSCASCHGFNGRGVGPLMTERDAWPRLLADGAGMSRLSNAYLKSLVREGGAAWNLSSVMPAAPNLTDEELDLIVGHVRALGVPRSDGQCCCAATGRACGMAEASRCGCIAVSNGGLCPRMRR